MKEKFVKTALAASILSTLFGDIGTAQATSTCFTGGALAVTAGTVPVTYDVYGVNCGAGNTTLTGSVSLKTGTQVQLQIGHENTTQSTLVSDTVTSAANCGTPSATTTAVSGGTGFYTVVVNKTTTAATTYDIRLTCNAGAPALVTQINR
jgi:hypothetical protein